MAITVVWDNKAEYILRWDMDATYSMEEFWDAFDETLRLVLEEVDAPRYDLLVNAPTVLRAPKDVLSGLVSINRRSAQYEQWPTLFVMCSENGFARSVIQMVATLTGNKNWRVTSSLAEGRTLISKSREKNPIAK